MRKCGAGVRGGPKGLRPVTMDGWADGRKERATGTTWVSAVFRRLKKGRKIQKKNILNSATIFPRSTKTFQGQDFF